MAAITAELSLDAAQFAAGLKRADASLKNFSARATATGRTAQKGMFGGFGRAANEAGELLAGALTGRSPATLLHRHFDELGRVLGPALLGGLAAVGVGQQVVGAIKKSMSAETMAISMEVLIGDATKAKQTLADLRKMAAATPFEFPDLASATKTLLGFGVANEDVLGTLSTISDVAQGNSETLSRLALVYGQIASTGRLMGQDLLQLINAGFNPLTVIAAKTGESMIELKKRMEAGQVSFAEVQAAFQSVTSEGGRFYRMNQRQSQTAPGLLSTLADAWGEVQMAFGDPIVDTIGPFIQGTIDLVKSLQDEAAAFGRAVSEAMLTAQAVMTAFSGADLGALVLNNLVLAYKTSHNVLWAGLNGAVAAFGQAMVEYVRYVINVFRILTKPDFWIGMKDAVISIAHVFGAVLLESAARTIELLKRIPGVTKVLGSPEAKMRETATALRGQAGISGAAGLDKLSPFLRQYGEGLRDSLGKITEAATNAANNSSKIWDTSAEELKNADAQKRLESRRKAMAAATQAAAAAAKGKTSPTPTGIAAAGQAATQGLGRPVGRLASAINLIMGRSANELIYDEAKKQTAQQEQMNKTLNNIDRNTRPRPGAPVPVGATFGRP